MHEWSGIETEWKWNERIAQYANGEKGYSEFEKSVYAC